MFERSNVVFGFIGPLEYQSLNSQADLLRLFGLMLILPQRAT